MSLVYEALQKAEKEKGRKTGATPLVPVATRIESPAPILPAAPPTPIIVAPAQTPVSRPPTSYLAAVIACVSIVALAGIVYLVVVAARNLAPPTATTDGGAHSVPAAAPVTPAGDPVPVPTAVASPVPGPVVTSPTFKLTGIMKIGDKFGAVVDGHIVYEGQYVEGAVVKSIERDHVTLNVDGHETVIRLF